MKRLFLVVFMLLILTINATEIISPVEGGHYPIYSTVDVIVEGQDVNKIIVTTTSTVIRDWLAPFIVPVILNYQFTETIFIKVTLNNGDVEFFDVLIYIDDDGVSDIQIKEK